MSQYKTINKKLIITSSSALAGVLLVSTLSSCLRNKNDKPVIDATDTTMSSISPDVSTSYYPSDNISDTSVVESSIKETYPFTWDEKADAEFDKYMLKKMKISMQDYVIYYGFTDEFNKVFTEFCNNKYGLNCKSVPFSKANYFFGYVNDIKRHHKNDEYEYFKLTKLNKEQAYTGIFANKLVLSYLVQNKIPFGTRIPLENFKALMKDQVYSYNPDTYEIFKDPKLGNHPSDHKYTAEQLAELLRQYNFAIYYLCVDYSVKTGNPEDKPEEFGIINQHLTTYYGVGAPQVFMVLSPDDYEKIFGEPVIEISYIDGAIVQTPQETMASPVSYIDYNNYNVYYNPNYNMYSEEDTGRTR